MSLLFLVSALFSVFSMPVGRADDFYFENFNNDGNYFNIVYQKTNEYYPIKKINDSLGVSISAESALAKDLKSGKILWAKNVDEKRSIASITKLMSAIVILKSPNIDWNKEIDITEADLKGDYNKLKILNGDKIRFEDLFKASLIISSNSGIDILVKNLGISSEDFVKKMNEEARSLGLNSTFFKDPTGLSNENISTAKEVLIFASSAFSYDKVRESTSKKTFSFPILNSEREVVIKNTNELLNSYLKIEAGKTGTTEDAGYCLVSEISYIGKGPIIAVVLRSASHGDRFLDLKSLAGWVFDNYEWKIN